MHVQRRLTFARLAPDSAELGVLRCLYLGLPWHAACSLHHFGTCPLLRSCWQPEQRSPA